MSSTLGFLFVLVALLISGSFSHRHGHNHDSSEEETHDQDDGNRETDDEHGHDEGREDFEWSATKPTSCPYEDPETHVCSSLVSCNGTCGTIRCCSSFNKTETPDEYDPEVYKEDDYNLYYLADIPGYCPLCISIANCTVYKCYEKCCEGYERDVYGRCTNESGRIQCENGGTLAMTYWGKWVCRCKAGFTGISCEIPVCQCENGGYCVERNGRPVCECREGYFGDRCEQSLCDKDCMNGGTCINDGTNKKCLCAKNYVGENCEKRYVNSAQCPPPYNSSRMDCYHKCDGNDDCQNGHICCQEGCSMMCRLPASSTCKHNNRIFAIGKGYSPDSCTVCNCTETGMVCATQSCAYPMCVDGQTPVIKRGVCCPVCPGDEHPEGPIRFLNCPNQTITLDVSETSDMAFLSTSTTRLVAVDVTGRKKFEVQYRPSYVQHCHCDDVIWNTQAVTAYAEDGNGNWARCQFNVKVRDVTPPVMKNCPNDIYVFEDESPSWNEPEVEDNVGIDESGYLTPVRANMEFHVGTHRVIFAAVDYDGNRAMCAFHVSVTDRSAAWEDMPQGLRERSTGNKPDHKAAIIGAVVGALALGIIAIVALVLCCRRRLNNASAQNDVRSHVGSEHIYAVPGDINPKLPMYKGYPVSPPPYSVNGDMKDGTYACLAPPAYTESNDGAPTPESYINPGYETLKVHK